MESAETQVLVLDTIRRVRTAGIPSMWMNIMDTGFLEEFAGFPDGSYAERPEEVYLAFQRSISAGFIDQFIPRNPLSMTTRGFDARRERGATTGVSDPVVDGILIDSPEAVCRHLESVVFPRMRRETEAWTAGAETRRTAEILAGERALQELFGPSIVKTGHGFVHFPAFRYDTYGYAHYFSAYALYPEVIERDFSMQADAAEINNQAAARAFREGNLPPLHRLDHDMADSRGLLVRPATLEKRWLPYFARSIKPLVDADINLVWHCDGNLMALVPLLLECGIRGFQGFQYEAGMDYEAVCRMTAADGNSLIIMGGVSVTTTLPFGTPEDVARELRWLVETGPRTGLFLGASSSVTPGTSRKNIRALIEGLRYYREPGTRNRRH